MNDNEAIDKLIEETEIDPDALLVEQYTKALHEICDRREWPGGALFIVRRNAGLISAFGTVNLTQNDNTLELMARAGDKGLKLAFIIKVLGED